MSNTVNLGLNKPEYGAAADVDVINRNMDLIDRYAGETNNAIQGKMPKPLNTGARGQVLRCNGGGGAEWDNDASGQEIGEAVTQWLNDNVPTGETVAVDETLTVSGAAADSQKTGNKFSDLEGTLSHAVDISNATWEIGTLNPSTGGTAYATDRIRSSYIESNERYREALSGNAKCLIVYFYNASKQFISATTWDIDNRCLNPEGTRFIKVLIRKSTNNEQMSSDDISAQSARLSMYASLPEEAYESDKIQEQLDDINETLYPEIDTSSIVWEIGTLNSGGGEAYSDNRVRSKYIDVKESDIAEVVGNANCMIVYYYNASKTFISQTSWADGNRVSVPSGVSFIRVLIRKSTNDDVLSSSDVATQAARFSLYASQIETLENDLEKLSNEFNNFTEMSNTASYKLELRAFRIITYNLENNSDVWRLDTGYKGALVPLEYIRDGVVLFPDTYKIVAAFLKDDNIVAGEVPNYCTGTTVIRLTAGSGKQSFKTPDDCQYLYVYVSNGTLYSQFGIYVKPYDIDTQVNKMYALKKHFDVTHTNTWADYNHENLTTIAHITDVHEDYRRMKWFAEFCKKHSSTINRAICTGDYVIPANATNLAKMIATYAGVYDIIPVIGNHEKAADSQSMTDDQIKAAFGISSLYYSVDIASDITLIVLDQYDTQDSTVRGHDGYYSQTQIDWFISKLINASSNGKAVIIGMHRWESKPDTNTKGFFQRHRQFTDTMVPYHCTGTPIGDIINAWLHGGSLSQTYTYDDSDATITVNTSFSNTNAMFIGYMCGHFHGDYVGYSSKYSDQLVLSLAAGGTVPYDAGRTLNYGGNGCDLPRITNTYTENAINVYGIDTVNRIIKIVRIGADLNDIMEPREVACFEF